MNLYQTYLLADALRQRVEETNRMFYTYFLTPEEKGELSEYGPWNVEIWLSSYADKSYTRTFTQEENEEFAKAWLEKYPDTQVLRREGQIHLIGQWPNGVVWRVAVGEGVCERVQVGTRKVMKPAPDAPMIEVEEPVYEVRCAEVQS